MKNPSSSNLAEIAKNIKLVVFDFDGVFTDNRVLVWEDGSEGVFCSRADGFGLEKLKKIGVQLLVISTVVCQYNNLEHQFALENLLYLLTLISIMILL